MDGVDFAELKDRIKGALRGMNGVSVDPNGLFYTECDKDYRDALEDRDIADVLAGRVRFYIEGKERIEEMPPMDALMRMLEYAYMEEMWSIEDAVLGHLKEDKDVAEWMGLHGIDDDGLRDCLMDVWYVQPPVDDYLKQDVCMDIMLDTGDCNYEFTCNNLASADIESVEDFDDNSSLLWLCEQQGVTREELLEAFDKGTAHTDEVIGLRARKAELCAELQAFGFASPRHGERVWHTGAYKEYVKVQDAVVGHRAYLEVLRGKFEENNLTYDEYLKKHFDRFERLDPMPEEQFLEIQKEVLRRFDEKILKASATYAQVKDRLDFGTDYRKIAILQSEFKDVKRELDSISKTEAYQKAEFIDSVCNERLNLSSDVGIVTFLVKMPLEEAIRIQEVIQSEASLNHSYRYEDRTGMSALVVGKDVRCGLLDITNGGGSLFEIALHKDVEIPIKAIYRAVSEAELGESSFCSIYGENDESYEEALKEIKVAPQIERVEDVIAGAQMRAHEPQAHDYEDLEMG